MEYIVKIDWTRQEIKTLEFDTRTAALEFLDDMIETLERMDVGASSMRRGEHVIGIAIPNPADQSHLISYELVGGAA